MFRWFLTDTYKKKSTPQEPSTAIFDIFVGNADDGSLSAKQAEHERVLLTSVDDAPEIIIKRLTRPLSSRTFLIGTPAFW